MELHSPKRVTAFFIGLFFLLWITPELALATEPFVKVTVPAGQVLRFSRGARSLSLGGIGTADPTSPNNTYYNPANAFLVDGLHFTQGYNAWPGDINFQDYGAYAGTAFELNPTTNLLVGGGVRYTHLAIEPRSQRTIFLPEQARILEFRDWYLAITAGGGLSTNLFDLGAGLSVKPTTMTLVDADKRFWAYDVGWFARFKFASEAGIRLVPSAGVSFLNLGGDVNIGGDNRELPGQLRAGVGIRFEAPSSESIEERLGIDSPVAAFGAAFEYLDRIYIGGDDGYGVGFEVSFLDVLSFRLGHSFDILTSDGTTYGIGLGWKFWPVRVQFDYARFPTSPTFTEDETDAYGVSIATDL